MASWTNNIGLFPARFGNIYTARQLLQLFERAYGICDPADKFWTTKGGRFIDPFRPRVQTGGFPTAESLLGDRNRHFRAVRDMFEQSDIFVFTLGLTEAWASKSDGMIFPLRLAWLLTRRAPRKPNL